MGTNIEPKCKHIEASIHKQKNSEVEQAVQQQRGSMVSES